MAIGFLPVNIVRNNFLLLLESQETRGLVRMYPRLHDWLTYVDHNYIRGPPQMLPAARQSLLMWNVWDRDMSERTNNVVECKWPPTRTSHTARHPSTTQAHQTKNIHQEKKQTIQNSKENTGENEMTRAIESDLKCIELSESDFDDQEKIDQIVPIVPNDTECEIKDVKLGEIQEPEQPNQQSRFYNPSESEISKLEDSRHETTTKTQTKWAIKIVTEWCTEQLKMTLDDMISSESFPEHLREFYASVRQKNGDNYSKSALNSRMLVQMHSPSATPQLETYTRNPLYEIHQQPPKPKATPQLEMYTPFEIHQQPPKPKMRSNEDHSNRSGRAQHNGSWASRIRKSEVANQLKSHSGGSTRSSTLWQSRVSSRTESLIVDEISMISSYTWEWLAKYAKEVINLTGEYN
ncbi:unnamed protein product [Owenia fusiformis]|uniref:Uncharacterized protein n=1 Tax=Owenia fusiformis TaxID=6347 RepID=A0A8S4PW35_OWEFU|nr:unnamed protein product [Owenia fusiformis]